jgi:hypothetical protein
MKTLNKSEYWLLDLVHRGSFPLHLLTHPELEIIANRDGHELSQSELLDTLSRLFQEGHLIGIRYPDDETWMDFIPTYKEVDLALRSLDKMQYQLTSKGGEEWETLSNPNWDWFIDDASANKEIIIQAKFRQVAEQYLQILPYFEGEVIYDSIKCQVLRPWQVTYWKILPEGYQIYARIKDSQIKLQQDMSIKEQEFMDRIENWRTDPFKSDSQ